MANSKARTQRVRCSVRQESASQRVGNQGFHATSQAVKYWKILAGYPCKILTVLRCLVVERKTLSENSVDGTEKLRQMLLSCRLGYRAGRRSLAVGMALALATRAAGLVPAIRAPTSSSITRSLSSRHGHAGTRAVAATGDTRLSSRVPPNGRAWIPSPHTPGASSHYDGGRLSFSAGRARRTMYVPASGSSAAAVNDGGPSPVDVSEAAVALDSQIKAKGDAIRKLKAEGASKTDLKPHIEVIRVFTSSESLCLLCEISSW